MAFNRLTGRLSVPLENVVELKELEREYMEDHF